MMRSTLLAGVLLACVAPAETPSAAGGPMLRLTATSANVTGAPDSIRIDLFRWSTDADREKLMSAWEMKPGAAVSRTGERGGGRGGRGGTSATPAAGNAARGSRGRGAARGEASAAPSTPEGQLTRALQESTTVGYLWSSEAAGYALRYAGKFAQPDGGERIILFTDRRLGDANALWRAASKEPARATEPGAAAATPYDFSIIELRVNANGTGEGKISLGEKLAADSTAGIVALPDYDSLPVVLTKLKQEKQ